MVFSEGILLLFPHPKSVLKGVRNGEFQKNIYFCFIDYAEVFDCVDHNKLWKILKGMRIPDHLNLSPEKCVCR